MSHAFGRPQLDGARHAGNTKLGGHTVAKKKKKAAAKPAKKKAKKKK
jgi:hypothetical protein